MVRDSPTMKLRLAVSRFHVPEVRDMTDVELAVVEDAAKEMDLKLVAPAALLEQEPILGCTCFWLLSGAAARFLLASAFAQML